ncbi:hypothetical protein BH09BAC6_BH09BAC6_14690 [soil metagenome]|jgi:hypothetical protein
MKQATDVLERMQDLEGKISLLNDIKFKEMEKPFNARDYKLLEFLWKELTTYSYAIKQFEWLLDINRA